MTPRTGEMVTAKLPASAPPSSPAVEALGLAKRLRVRRRGVDELEGDVGQLALEVGLRSSAWWMGSS
jgi:hypothetical protein